MARGLIVIACLCRCVIGYREEVNMINLPNIDSMSSTPLVVSNASSLALDQDQLKIETSSAEEIPLPYSYPESDQAGDRTTLLQKRHLETPEKRHSQLVPRTTTESDAKLWTAHHNFHRGQYKSKYLSWSQKLAREAQIVSERCVFAHSKHLPGRPVYGENLFVGTSNIPFIMQSWMHGDKESAWYDPRHPHASHFTATIWRATTHVGCAVARCNWVDKFKGSSYYVQRNEKIALWTCKYWPPGNVETQYGKNVVLPPGPQPKGLLSVKPGYQAKYPSSSPHSGKQPGLGNNPQSLPKPRPRPQSQAQTQPQQDPDLELEPQPQPQPKSQPKPKPKQTQPSKQTNAPQNPEIDLGGLDGAVPEAMLSPEMAAILKDLEDVNMMDMDKLVADIDRACSSDSAQKNGSQNQVAAGTQASAGTKKAKGGTQISSGKEITGVNQVPAGTEVSEDDCCSPPPIVRRSRLMFFDAET